MSSFQRHRPSSVPFARRRNSSAHIPGRYDFEPDPPVYRQQHSSPFQVRVIEWYLVLNSTQKLLCYKPDELVDITTYFMIIISYFAANTK